MTGEWLCEDATNHSRQANEQQNKSRKALNWSTLVKLVKGHLSHVHVCLLGSGGVVLGKGPKTESYYLFLHPASVKKLPTHINVARLLLTKE